MDSPPRWVRLLSAGAWLAGLVAVLAGPAHYEWQPAADDRWAWPAGLSIVDGRPDVVVLDLFLAAEQDVSALHARGRAVVCQLRAGVWETGRPDAARIDRGLIGGAADPGARWLDVRRYPELAEAIGDRLALCAGKGFDGVVLADLDGYAHPTGFPLTADDQMRFNTALAAAAAAYGLRVAAVATPLTPIPSNVDVTVNWVGAAGAGTSGRSTRSGS